jgi:phage-related protein
MAFHANTFIFDNIPSETMNLYLGEIGGSGESSTGGSNPVELSTEKIYRNPVPLFYGVEQTPVLSFPLSMYSPGDLDEQEYSAVAAWLFGQQEYKKLKICQNDMSDIYFNCFLTNPQVVRLGNTIRGISCLVLCDAPWGWKESKSYSYTYDPNAYSVFERIELFNESANAYYTYPTSLIIQANVFGGELSIINASDNNREFLLSLSPNEIVSINCDTQQIISNVTEYPLSNFNLEWLRLIKGWNYLTLEGNIVSLHINYPVAVKIG